MDIYSLKDYEVSISFEHSTFGWMMNHFEVMAYTPEEAEDKAFSKWSDLDYDHKGTLTYQTEQI